MRQIRKVRSYMKCKEALGLLFAGIYFVVCIGGSTIFLKSETCNVEGKKTEAILAPVTTSTVEEQGKQQVEKQVEEVEKKINEGIIYTTADEDYFKDTVFIGDSRTEGFGMQAEIENINCYAKKGLAVNTFFHWKVVKENGKDKTILQALKSKNFKKVYIMFGYNELGWPTEDGFIKQYKKVINSIKKMQPDAEIYIQSVIYVSKSRSETEKYENNKNIIKRNKAIKKMADELGCYYLNLNEVFSDNEGNLVEGAATDGIHLTKEYCHIWKKFLLKHIVAKKEA